MEANIILFLILIPTGFFIYNRLQLNPLAFDSGARRLLKRSEALAEKRIKCIAEKFRYIPSREFFCVCPNLGQSAPENRTLMGS